MPLLFAIFAALLYDPQMLLPIIGGNSSATAQTLTFVSSTTKYCGNSSAVCTVTYSPTAGNLIVVLARSYTTSTATVTDNASGGSSTYATNNTNNAMYAASSCNVKSGATTITVTFDIIPVLGGGFVVLEFSGQKTSSCYDASSAKAGPTSGASMSSNSLTPTGSGEVSAMVGITGDGSDKTLTGTNGYTCFYASVVVGGETVGGCYKIKTDSSAQVATADWNTSVGWINFQSMWKPGP